MKNGSLQNPQKHNGFTLLEVSIALILIGLLSGLIFATARYSLLLGSEVVKSQNQEMTTQAFFSLLENQFASLPGNTRMQITSTDAGSHYLSDITLQNVPISLTWGNENRTAKAIQLSTVKRATGHLDIVLRYYENEIIDPTRTNRLNSNSNSTPTTSSEKPFAEIILLTNVLFFEWRVIDSRDPSEILYEWNLPGRLPIQLELTCSFGGSGETIRQIFWIPQRQNPEFFTKPQAASHTIPNPTTPNNPIETPKTDIFPPPTQ